MLNSKTAPTDPRERLMTVGNRLLDAVYELESTQEKWEAITAVKGDDVKLQEMLKEGGIEFMLKRLEAIGRRDSALREYVAIRATMEALADAPTVDLPDDPMKDQL